MLRINFSNQAKKFLKKLPGKHGKQIAGKIIALRIDPQPNDSKQLKGKYSVYRRTDFGEYRIIYRVEEQVLHVVVIGKRNDDECIRYC